MKNVIRLTESDFVNLVQRTIEEQMNPQRPVFAPSHKATVEVDCKSKLVRISNYAGKFNKQANATLVDVFCNPQNRAVMKEEQEDTIVPCSSLGIKSPGFCDKNTKKVLDKVPCAKLGIKSPGMCDAKTKKPV